MTSFDDLGDDDHVVALRRRIAQRLFHRKTGPRNVVLPDVRDGERMGRRLDATYVHFVELFDMMEHAPELLRENGFFLGREGKPRKFRDVVDIQIGSRGHGG